jgi:glycosyltransferase involved in cell wall biosynthesis
VTSLLLVAQPPVAGVPRHVLDVVEELGAEGFEITVACPPDSFLWHELRAHPHVRLAPFTSRREPHLSDIAWMVRLVRLVRDSDVVHAHSSKASWVVRAAALIAGRRSTCVVTPHAWSFWALSGVHRRAVVALERVAARACAAIIVVSRHEQEEGLKLGIGRAAQYRLIRNGVDLKRYAIDGRRDPDTVLMVGRLAPQKRPELAVRALELPRRRRPAMRLAIAGDGALESAVVQLVREMGLGESVQLLGSRDDVPALMAVAGCVLVTSAYEGCSLVILEAMAAGVPVVAVRTGGIDEVVEHGVTGLVCGEDPESVATALVDLANDPEMARRLGTGARHRARERYSRRRMARHLAALYGSIAAPGMPRGSLLRRWAGRGRTSVPA